MKIGLLSVSLFLINKRTIIRKAIYYLSTADDTKEEPLAIKKDGIHKEIN